MGPIAAAFVSGLTGKIFGGGDQQQPQAPIFQYQRTPMRLPVPLDPWQLRGANPADARLADSPIMQAMDTAAPVEEQPKKNNGQNFNFKDAFLASITQNLAQRLIFGGGPQNVQTYTPPTFR